MYEDLHEIGEPDVELKERQKSYRLLFILSRHGPKIGVNGSLSPEGFEQTKEVHRGRYTSGAPTEEMDVVVSPIFRTWETGQAATSALLEHEGQLGDVDVDARLTEGVLSENEDRVNEIGRLTGGPDGRHGRMLVAWLTLEKRLANWPEMMLASEAAANVANVILERIDKQKKKGGNKKVEAFSHGPVLAAFLDRLEQLSGQQILPADWKEQAVHGVGKETSPMWTIFDFNSHVALSTSSDKPEEFTLEFTGKSIKVPLHVLREMAAQGSVNEESEQLAAK